jgi:uncharacterized membrane protein YoaK (UPF0700 family)
MKRPVLVNLLSFNGGFVDTAGFLGLQGLFTAHVTGNFVTLGYATAAILYVWAGFWRLAVPVVVGAVTAAVRIRD